MTIQDTIALVNAGYTKADIEAMGAQVAAEQTQLQTDDKTAAAQPDPEQTSENAAAMQQIIEQNNKLLEQLRTIQAQNVAGAESQKETGGGVADVIRSFIEAK